MKKFIRLNSVLALALLIAAGLLLTTGCTTLSVNEARFSLSKTAPEPAQFLSAPMQKPRKLLMLPLAEAVCPNQCARISHSSRQDEYVAETLRLLMKRGYEIIDGAVVVRVEEHAEKPYFDETWDRLEKALLLGKNSGADAILTIDRLYVDYEPITQMYEKPERGKAPAGAKFEEVPERLALKAGTMKPKTVSVFKAYVWNATVEMRLIDMSGKVIWTGTKTIRSTDIIPETWTAQLVLIPPMARIKIKDGVEAFNYDYYMYLYNEDKQRQALLNILNELVKKMPMG